MASVEDEDAMPTVTVEQCSPAVRFLWNAVLDAIRSSKRGFLLEGEVEKRVLALCDENMLPEQHRGGDGAACLKWRDVPAVVGVMRSLGVLRVVPSTEEVPPEDEAQPKDEEVAAPKDEGTIPCEAKALAEDSEFEEIGRRWGASATQAAQTWAWKISQTLPFTERVFELAKEGRFSEMDDAGGEAVSETLLSWCFHKSTEWKALRGQRTAELDSRQLRTIVQALTQLHPQTTRRAVREGRALTTRPLRSVASDTLATCCAEEKHVGGEMILESEEETMELLSERALAEARRLNAYDRQAWITLRGRQSLDSDQLHTAIVERWFEELSARDSELSKNEEAEEDYEAKPPEERLAVNEARVAALETAPLGLSTIATAQSAVVAAEQREREALRALCKRHAIPVNEAKQSGGAYNRNRMMQQHPRQQAKSSSPSSWGAQSNGFFIPPQTGARRPGRPRKRASQEEDKAAPYSSSAEPRSLIESIACIATTPVPRIGSRFQGPGATINDEFEEEIEVEEEAVVVLEDEVIVEERMTNTRRRTAQLEAERKKRQKPSTTKKARDVDASSRKPPVIRKRRLSDGDLVPPVLEGFSASTYAARARHERSTNAAAHARQQQAQLQQHYQRQQQQTSQYYNQVHQNNAYIGDNGQSSSSTNGVLVRMTARSRAPPSAAASRRKASTVSEARRSAHDVAPMGPLTHSDFPDDHYSRQQQQPMTMNTPNGASTANYFAQTPRLNGSPAPSYHHAEHLHHQQHMSSPRRGYYSASQPLRRSTYVSNVLKLVTKPVSWAEVIASMESSLPPEHSYSPSIRGSPSVGRSSPSSSRRVFTQLPPELPTLEPLEEQPTIMTRRQRPAPLDTARSLRDNTSRSMMVHAASNSSLSQLDPADVKPILAPSARRLEKGEYDDGVFEEEEEDEEELMMLSETEMLRHHEEVLKDMKLKIEKLVEDAKRAHAIASPRRPPAASPRTNNAPLRRGAAAVASPRVRQKANNAP